MQIAHISDLHIDYKDRKLIKEIDKLVRIIQKNKIEHIIITGDMIHLPCEKNYWVLKKILKKYGYWDYNKLTVTIGNHEIFGGAEKTHTFPYQCKYTDYKKRVKNFLSFFTEILFCNGTSSFPIFKELSNNIVLIIINSVAHWSQNKNPIGSNGNVDSIQIKNLNKVLRKENYKHYIKIAVIHHHFYYTANKTYDEMHRLWLYSERDTMVMHNFRNVFNHLRKNKIDLILHGHTHYTNLYKKQNIKIINSSGCIKPLSQVKKKLFTLIDLKEEMRKIDIKHLEC
ncbi:MAG: metallophosphoesterase [Ignavibacteria bacterium]|nr:metallophosphoesterase [Ignavibacteria bacterium]